MSADVTKLGTLLDESAQRDAVHVAVAPVVAGETLYPGQHIGFMSDGDTETVVSIADGPRGLQNKPALGIVDPFLTTRVPKGERCWMFLYPQTITSLRHQWTHPAFEAAPPSRVDDRKAASENWLRDFIARNDLPRYEDVIRIAIGEDVVLYQDSSYGPSRNEGEYLMIRGTDAYAQIPPEFWEHVEIVTGKKVESSMRASYFSCSC